MRGERSAAGEKRRWRGGATVAGGSRIGSKGLGHGSHPARIDPFSTVANSEMLRGTGAGRVSFVGQMADLMVEYADVCGWGFRAHSHG